MNLMKLVYILIVLMVAQVAIAQELPAVQDLSIDREIGEVNATLDSIPDTLNGDLIPNETATQLFAYVKWFFSDASAEELAGRTLAPIVINLYIYLLIAFTFASIWLTIRVLVLGWRLILFIIDWIIKLIELFPVLQ